MDKVERDNLIVKMRADGESMSSIAQKLSLPATTVRVVLDRFAYCIVSASPPEGMSIRTAWLIWQSFGTWPTSGNTEALALRKYEFMRAAGTKRKDWQDFDAWLDRVLPPLY
ncbi:hypothetical protein [Neorhizobium galegae]|uniref:hypothetical protein n=1 Tax=Neorhizobium galegae TaxID=399 RepID=UPI002103891A|nr:hypothetical protein [Neorhizobium galegae]MCQ1855816.1 hypothetical protein [Neorhizobium galegae]